MAVRRRPPRGATGVSGWLRTNLFNSWFNAIATIVVGALLLGAIFGLASWILFEASWGRIWVNLKLFAVFRYPAEALWRPLAVLALILGLLGITTGASRRLGESPILTGIFLNIGYVVLGLTVLALIFWESVRWLWLLVALATAAGYLLGQARPRLSRILPWAWALSFPIGLLLLYGVRPGEGFLHFIAAREWGGFMLTLILTTGLLPSFPLGIALALGRRSELPAIRYVSIGFIEVVRGAPLIMWLFIASLLLPLLLNTDANNLPAVLRAYVAVTLFSAAYMAENVRGGLQAVPYGQMEASRALGLSGWQTTRLIVLPQALRAVIPTIVGQAIGLFKDTSLVFIVGLGDFFNVGLNIVANQPESLLIPGGILLEISLFLALGYWFFAFRMSVASRQLEKQLGVGVR